MAFRSVQGKTIALSTAKRKSRVVHTKVIHRIEKPLDQLPSVLAAAHTPH